MTVVSRALQRDGHKNPGASIFGASGKSIVLAPLLATQLCSSASSFAGYKKAANVGVQVGGGAWPFLTALILSARAFKISETL